MPGVFVMALGRLSIELQEVGSGLPDFAMVSVDPREPSPQKHHVLGTISIELDAELVSLVKDHPALFSAALEREVVKFAARLREDLAGAPPADNPTET